MMRVILFGPGYCGQRIASRFNEQGHSIVAIGRDMFDAAPFAGADLILSTVPPQDGVDPVLARHGDAIARSSARLIYLSSTGVYGDAGGGWVDETAALLGRRADRIAADRQWLDRGAYVLRLPGIYGPGRSVTDRLIAGSAHRIDQPDQVFSRIHVDDVVEAVVIAGRTDAPAGAYNIADDLPTAQSDLIVWAAAKFGIDPPAAIPIDDAGLSPAARAFYAENRRVANGKAKRLLGWRPLYPDYRAGLRALIATTRPVITSTPPAIAVGVQR